MNAPTGAMTLLDTELRVILAALEEYWPNNGAEQELKFRAVKKLRQELEIKERPYVTRRENGNEKQMG